MELKRLTYDKIHLLVGDAALFIMIDAKKGYAPGVPFAELEKFRCPSCAASRKYFVVEEKETLRRYTTRMH